MHEHDFTGAKRPARSNARSAVVLLIGNPPAAIRNCSSSLGSTATRRASTATTSA
jgi:hypothetical protein